MKKHLILAGIAVVALTFVGCGGGGGGGTPPPPPAADVLYLDDINGVGIGNVPYTCDSGSGVTDPDGAFYFLWGDTCTFDLFGFDGSFVFSLHVDDVASNGVGGIPFSCQSGWNGATYGDGSFEYEIDDICTFAF